MRLFHQGIYRLVYALPQADHNFEFIYDANEDVVFNFDMDSGVEFIDSKENQTVSLIYSSHQRCSKGVAANVFKIAHGFSIV